MARLGLLGALFLGLAGCFGSDCIGDDCSYFQQQAVWSQDDLSLALTIPDFGDESASHDNRYYIYTLNTDGSEFSPKYELREPAHVKSYNSDKNMVLLELDPQRYSNTFEGYEWINMNTGERANLLQWGPNNSDCYFVDVSASLDFSFIAIIFTPRDSCENENTSVVFFNTESQTFDGVLEPANNYKNRFSPSIYYTWSPSGLLIQDYSSDSRNQFYLIDPNTKTATLNTQTSSTCGVLGTNSTIYSATGLTADVEGYVGQNEASVIFEQTNKLLEICQ